MYCLITVDSSNGNEKAHVLCKILIRSTFFKNTFISIKFR